MINTQAIDDLNNFIYLLEDKKSSYCKGLISSYQRGYDSMSEKFKKGVLEELKHWLSYYKTEYGDRLKSVMDCSLESWQVYDTWNYQIRDEKLQKDIGVGRQYMFCPFATKKGVLDGGTYSVSKNIVHSENKTSFEMVDETKSYEYKDITNNFSQEDIEELYNKIERIKDKG